MELSSDLIEQINNFKLIGKNAKMFKYGPSQKKLLIDLVKWCKAGGDPFDNPDNTPRLRGLNNDVMAEIILYKNDPGHTINWDNSVEEAIKVFGQICTKPLYRGVSKAELDSITKKIDEGYTKFKRDRSTSFTTDFKHADNFATYGGGSAIDDINRIEHGIERQPGAVLTVYCSKPIFFIDELSFYLVVASHMIGEVYEDKDLEADQEYEPMGVCWSENEWIIPASAEWKLVDKNKLIFKI